MAVTKEAIVIVLNVGQSMLTEKKKCLTILENAKNCISMIIQRKILSESKDEIALILFGTDVTANNLAEQGHIEFSNVEVVQDLKPANWELLECVSEVKGTDMSCDSIKDNALLVAIDLLLNTNKSKKFFSRRILFLSDFENLFDSEQAARIRDELTSWKIELNIIGPVSIDDADDTKNGTHLPLNPDGKTTHSSIRAFLKEVNGDCYSFSEALSALIYFQKKKVQPTAWNADLEIGSKLSIPISVYNKITENKPKTWKNSYASRPQAKIERNVTYMMNDVEQTKVQDTETIKAFKYGTTLVPFTEDDKQNMDYQSGEKGMKVLGFTKLENIHRYHFAGDKSAYVFGQKSREISGIILAPFIHALAEMKMVAIVRYVYSARSSPKIGFLAPKIKSTYECLVFIHLPFMEDLRHYVFSSLDSNPKNIPTEEQLNAVDDLITSMDLSTAVMDEDGNLSEYLKPKDTVNPYLQRLCQCLQERGLHPEKPLPEIPAHIKEMLYPPEKLVKMSESAMERIKELYPLKVIEQKKRKGDVLGEEQYSIEKADGSRKRRKIDIDNIPDIYDPSVTRHLLQSNVIKQVGSVTPVEDFLYLIKNSTLPFGEACKQIIGIANQYLQSDNSKHYHTKIVGICKELRQASIKENTSVQYNEFMKDLKEELLLKDLDLWKRLREENIGLLTSSEVSLSKISSADATSFLLFESQVKPTSSVPPDEYDDEDDDDLLGQL